MIAESVPMLDLFISLIGSMCSTSLALLMPPLIELVSKWGLSDRPKPVAMVKNFVIILIGAFCFVTGTYESVSELVNRVLHGKQH